MGRKEGEEDQKEIGRKEFQDERRKRKYLTKEEGRFEKKEEEEDQKESGRKQLGDEKRKRKYLTKGEGKS